ncbi:MAG: hypothetical protein JWN86_846 [Planctomycetota bacterium]|nr:hypothetical protein [Planctomycetota bacterium]
MTGFYSMLIQSSDADHAFLVTFPELAGETPETPGDRYGEAARNGQDALEGLLATFQARKLPLPPPSLNVDSEASGWVGRTSPTA